VVCSSEACFSFYLSFLKRRLFYTYAREKYFMTKEKYGMLFE